MANTWHARLSPVRARRPLYISVRAALLAGTALGLLAGGAHAADTDWTGATDSDWFIGTNWSTGTVPTVVDLVNIDTGSAWVAAPGAEAVMVFVGNNATGDLQVFQGGTLEADVQVVVGSTVSGEGNVTVSGVGSTLVGGDSMTFGSSGRAELDIFDGGVVETGTSLDGRVFAGISSTGSSMITIGGTGSALRSGGELVLGVEGSAELLVSDGGRVDAGWNFGPGSGALTLGALAGGTGSATFIEDGTLLAAFHRVAVGDAGTGALNIISGADASITGVMRIGESAGGVGFVSVQGAGSTVSLTGSVFVGHEGTGTLLIRDSGVLQNNSVLSIGQSATGSGAVTVTGSGSTMTIGNTIDIGASGQGILTIADGGTVTATNGVGIAFAVGSTGTLNIGAEAGDAAAATGTLNAANITFGDGAGTINFNHTTGSGAAAPVGGYDFSAALSGSGTINHLAGVTTLSGVSTSFTGTTNITGGKLYIKDTLSGEINVSGGLLGGGGYLLGNVTVGSGGTFAPGNSIGSLSLASDLTFNAGSVYEVELNDGGFVAGTNNDFVSAGGATTINGGTVHVTPVFGEDDGSTYTPGTYTILTAAGGVSGAFDPTVTDSFLFLGFSLDYDANNVYLNSFQTAGFVDIAQTPNQIAVAGPAGDLGTGNPVFDALVTLTDEDEARAALDALSGEIHASAKTALIEDSRFLREAVNERVRAAFGEAVSEEGTTFWAHGFGAGGSWASDGNAARPGRSIGGLFIGGDAAVSDEIRLGLVGGYSRASLGVDDRASSGAASSYHLGLYGGGRWGDFALRGGASHSWHSIDIARQVAFTGFADSLSATYGARSMQVFGEAGYGFTAGRARFEPYAGLAHVRLNTDRFAETGGAAALSAAGQSASATFTTIGLRAETTVVMGETEAKLRGGLAWRHAFGGVPTSVHSFVSGSDAFTIAGVPLARDAMVLEAGFDVKLAPAATLGLSYNGQFGSGLSDHGLKASLGVRF